MHLDANVTALLSGVMSCRCGWQLDEVRGAWSFPLCASISSQGPCSKHFYGRHAVEKRSDKKKTSHFMPSAPQPHLALLLAFSSLGFWMLWCLPGTGNLPDVVS